MAVIARSGQRAGAVVVRAFPWRFLVVPLAMSALALGSAAAAELAYSSRALPGLTVAGDANQAPVSGELALAGGDLRITPPQLGREIDGGVTVARLLSATTLGDREVALSVRAVYPPLDASGFDDAYAAAAAALTPLVVRVEDRGWSESSSALP